jgi:hypothetical protein
MNFTDEAVDAALQKAQQADGQEPQGAEAEIRRMLTMGIIEREQERTRIAEHYGIRMSIVDTIARQLEAQDTTDVVSRAEPYHSDVDGVQLLDDIAAILHNHMVLPDGAAEAIALWILWTYCFDHFRIAPILAIISPQKRCGKSRLLEILNETCEAPLLASNITAAAVFRTVQMYHPTLLVDEADSFLPKNEELRGVFNSGHTKASAFVVRCDGETNEPKKFSTWSPKAIAGIGKLPGTIQDRSIMVSLKRKLPGEKIANLNSEFFSQADLIRQRCRRWADDHVAGPVHELATVGITNNDRAEDNWAPIATIASIAGGDWLDRVRSAALSGLPDDDRDDLSLMLLRDIRDVFTTDRVFSDDLVEKLNDLADRPWPDLKHGNGLTQNTLARYLSPFGIAPKKIKIHGASKRGYTLEMFGDVFDRYLEKQTATCLSQTPPYQTGTPEPFNDINGLQQKQSGTQGGRFHSENKRNQLNILDSSGVPLQTGGVGENKCADCRACDGDTCYGGSFFTGRAASPMPCKEAILNCPAELKN